MHLLLLAWGALSCALAGKLVIVGDSLSEGYGVTREAAYPYLIDKDLEEWSVQNASISGSTGASAPSRMAWALRAKPDAVLLALGANDGLRGLDQKALAESLKKAIALARGARVRVGLVGMKAPPNYGPEYQKSFEKVFRDVSREARVPLMPFLLEGVAGNPSLNQADGIHPNEEGHRRIATQVLKFVKKELGVK